jgi:hypothetical protein
MRKKIGIITIHHVSNYGAMLQAYGLSRYLRDQGHDAEVVDYRPPEAVNYFRPRLASVPPPVNKWVRWKRCMRFVDRHLPLSSKQYTTVESFAPDATRYQYLITGSDQVWFTGPYQFYDPMFFLDFPAPGVRKISYAPSAGGKPSFDPYTDRAKAALSDFWRISVRDPHTNSLVEPLIGYKPPQVIDPAFLSGFDLTPEMATPPQVKPYLVVFGDFRGPAVERIAGLAQRAGLDIVTLQYKFAAATQRLPAPDPVTWLRYIRHAAVVVTSYFHGTAFAVKYHRPLLSIPTPGRQHKVKGLLESVGLASQYLPDFTDPAPWQRVPEIDWAATDRLLNAQIASSKQYLDAALQSGNPTAVAPVLAGVN